VFFSRTEETTAYTNEDPGNVRGLRTNHASRNQALFGQIAHHFSARTRLVLGVRLEQIELTGQGTRTRFRKGPGTYDVPRTFSPRFEDVLLGGKATLEQEFADGHLAFVSVTRGYKAGGINVDARINPPADPLTYATEILWNYEAGLRGHWLDRRLTGEFTVFRIDRRDTQVRDSAGFGGNYRFFTANAGHAHVHGLESSGAFAVTPSWSLRGSLALMRSELAPFTLPNGNPGGGRELANTPRYGYTLGVRHGTGRGFFANADLVGRARQFDSNNQDEARRAFHVVNARMGYAWRDWTFTLWAKNLLDEAYDQRVFFFGNADPDYIATRYEDRAAPRQLGVTAAWRF
jgi:outer membrane receptor protein involved in Fe transport